LINSRRFNLRNCIRSFTWLDLVGPRATGYQIREDQSADIEMSLRSLTRYRNVRMIASGSKGEDLTLSIQVYLLPRADSLPPFA
jgi:hypothetical protein